jgi:PhzF family phenazine biosynthesis protein
MRYGELWQVRVFTGEQALGNATGVVRLPDGESPAAMAEWARLLGFPDTAFLSGPLEDPGHVRIDSFSPYEEMRFCTQTLLGAEYVLRETGLLAGAQALTARTQVGHVRVMRYADEPGMAYVEVPGSRVSVRPLRVVFPEVVGLAEAEPLVVDTGRARVYCLLPPEVLESVVLAPERVRDYCRREGVSGICLTARQPEGAGRLRVFTMSLDGREDAATGGAAGGVPLYWERIGVERVLHPLVVQQGYGGPQTRGDLWVRRTGGGGVAVGGRTRPVASGTLADG